MTQDDDRTDEWISDTDTDHDNPFHEFFNDPDNFMDDVGPLLDYLIDRLEAKGASRAQINEVLQGFNVDLTDYWDHVDEQLAEEDADRKAQELAEREELEEE